MSRRVECGESEHKGDVEGRGQCLQAEVLEGSGFDYGGVCLTVGGF